MSTNNETKGTFSIVTTERHDTDGNFITRFKEGTVTPFGDKAMKMEDWQTMLEGVFQMAESQLKDEFVAWADEHHAKLGKQVTSSKWDSFWADAKSKVPGGLQPLAWLPNDHMVVDQISLLETYINQGNCLTDLITTGGSIRQNLMDPDDPNNVRAMSPISFMVTVAGQEISQSTGKVLEKRKTARMVFWTDPKTGRACFESFEMRRAREAREKAEALVLQLEADDVKKAFGEEVAKSFLNLPKDAKLAMYKAAKQHLENM
jgi:hypothetical protein